MRQHITAIFFLLGASSTFAGTGFFGLCPAFITVGGTLYEVGDCGANPDFPGTNLTNVSSFDLTYAEIQTFENSGDDIQNGFLNYRIWTGVESGLFTAVTLSNLVLLGNGDERRSATTSIDLLAGLLPSTTYTLEIYYQATGNSPAQFHSNGGNNYELSFTTAALLPVELIDFNFSRQISSIDLSWHTVSEQNNSHFNIQRLADALNWLTVGKINGNGTTATAQFYNFTDWQPLPGMNYYRLQQVDYDGQFEYSKVVYVDFDNGRSITIAPNPVVNELIFTLPEAANDSFTVIICDLNGSILQQTMLLGNTLNVSGIPQGLNFVQLIDTNNKVLLSERFVRQ